MLEARAFVPEIESARKTLELNGAIFTPINSDKSLKDEFLRPRIQLKNIWNEKDMIVSIKQTEKRSSGKNSIIPLRKEFDSESEARKFIDENLKNDFEYDFEFTRTGWQYDLGENQVDLEKVEDIPNCYTIEVKSLTENGLKDLIEMLSIPSLIQGPSVVEIKRLLFYF